MSGIATLVTCHDLTSGVTVDPCLVIFSIGMEKKIDPLLLSFSSICRRSWRNLISYFLLSLYYHPVRTMRNKQATRLVKTFHHDSSNDNWKRLLETYRGYFSRFVDFLTYITTFSYIHSPIRILLQGSPKGHQINSFPQTNSISSESEAVPPRVMPFNYTVSPWIFEIDQNRWGFDGCFEGAALERALRKIPGKYKPFFQDVAFVGYADLLIHNCDGRSAILCGNTFYFFLFSFLSFLSKTLLSCIPDY